MHVWHKIAHNTMIVPEDLARVAALKDFFWPKAAIGVFDISTYRIAALRV